jgi:hypothetical protein
MAEQDGNADAEPGGQKRRDCATAVVYRVEAMETEERKKKAGENGVPVIPEIR